MTIPFPEPERIVCPGPIESTARERLYRCLHGHYSERVVDERMEELHRVDRVNRQRMAEYLEMREKQNNPETQGDK